MWRRIGLTIAENENRERKRMRPIGRIFTRCARFSEEHAKEGSRDAMPEVLRMWRP